MTLLINLYGAPGSGKSTGAAYIFSRLKMLDINCELVTEFAKDKVWEESKEVFNNQVYIFGKQYFRLSRLNKKVDVIVTDSPLFNSKIYANDKIIGNMLASMALHIEKTEFAVMNFFVNRTKKYNPKGRFQTEQQSDEISKKINTSLTKHGIACTYINGDKLHYDIIINNIKEHVKKCNSNTRI